MPTTHHTTYDIHWDNGSCWTNFATADEARVVITRLPHRVGVVVEVTHEVTR